MKNRKLRSILSLINILVFLSCIFDVLRFAELSPSYFSGFFLSFDQWMNFFLWILILEKLLSCQKKKHIFTLKYFLILFPLSNDDFLTRNKWENDLCFRYGKIILAMWRRYFSKWRHRKYFSSCASQPIGSVNFFFICRYVCLEENIFIAYVNLNNNEFIIFQLIWKLFTRIREES